ncbi:MAG: class I tRNA ligase family protein, partial [Methanomassiliicoccales archaeon]|nr:class I tRNA ligase family protein [Methanomassiliicoccales archaeon]
MGNAWAEIETKWQKRWYEAGINEANRDDRPKFMMIFAYPGVTGYLHVGHMRGFSYVDAMTRYRRMLGYNVLFPVGTHATGNGAISLANRVRRRDERTIDYLLANGCPDEKLKELEDPLKVVDFFNQVYVNDYWKRFGFLADWRRFTSTTYPDYGKFIQWQFRKLMEKGLLIQKPYYAPACVNDGPVAIDASETDIQKGGNAETNEYTLLKFRLGDMFLVAATLRPETVYGQTNFWVNPDVEYAKVRHGDETWVMSFESYEKMRYQKEGLEVIGKISGRDLMGVRCIAPVIHREVMVLPAKFCDPNVGTGLVTSVPSDAPDDWIALKNLQDDPDMMASYHLDADEVRAIVPIAIIDTKGWGP